jgi:transglutaminase-like putative cysteine protease
MNYGSTPTSTYGAMYNLMNYLNDNIGYGYYYDTYYGAVGTWNNREGNCCDSAHLMIACARSLGVPGRYVHAYASFSSGLVTGHVWAEVLCGNEWWTADLVSDYNYLGYKTNSTLEVYGRYRELPF